MTDIELIKSYRDKCFTLTAEELSIEVEKFKKQVEEDTTGVKKYEYLLLSLIINDAIYLEYNVRDVEDAYQRLVEQPWVDNEDDFPFEIKIELLYYL